MEKTRDEVVNELKAAAGVTALLHGCCIGPANVYAK